MSTRIRLELPEPPSLNQMIELAKKRTRRTRGGGFMKRSLPIVYDQHLEAYELQCTAAIREAGVRAPSEPWARWRLVSMHFRLHSTRDWLELAAGAKWAVDFLVRAGFVLQDSPREMERPESWPTQEISRKDRGVVLVIERVA
ncbi:MAG: hypothetical protein KY464_17430 [Gemmatimonadetes bacterium]|nr:hypothetical protein [Gemmatimonadota bacterium]